MCRVEGVQVFYAKKKKKFSTYVQHTNISPQHGELVSGLKWFRIIGIRLSVLSSPPGQLYEANGNLKFMHWSRVGRWQGVERTPVPTSQINILSYVISGSGGWGYIILL